MSMYEKLDNLIVEKLAAAKCPLPLFLLWGGAVFQEVRHMHMQTAREPLRIIDGRLQALKKAGRIRFQRGVDGGWVLTEAA